MVTGRYGRRGTGGRQPPLQRSGTGAVIGLPSSVLAEEVHGDGTLPARHDDQQRLARQLELLERWLRSDDARATAARLLTRRGLANSADDLLQDGWVRIHESVARRSEPYRDLDKPEHAARFGARVLETSPVTVSVL